MKTYNDAFTGGFAGAGGSGSDDEPAAWLNMVMYSATMDPDLSLPMSAIQVSNAANFHRETLTIGPIDIPAPGYVYIYVDNIGSSDNDVIFDNLEVTHLHAPFVAGGDYYPFGLPIADRQIDVEPYRWGYQGQFSEKDSVTGWNEFDLRMYDARFGRWLSIDPMEQFWSSYVGMGNQPTNGTDPDGSLFGLNTPWSQIFGTLAGAGTGAIVGLALDWANDGEIDDGYWWRGALIGGAAGFVAGELTAGNQVERMGTKVAGNRRNYHANYDRLRRRTHYQESKWVDRNIELFRENGDKRSPSRGTADLGADIFKSYSKVRIKIERSSGTSRITRNGRQVREFPAGGVDTYNTPEGTSNLRIDVDPDLNLNGQYWYDYNRGLDNVNGPIGQARITMSGLTPRVKIIKYRSSLTGLRIHRTVRVELPLQ